MVSCLFTSHQMRSQRILHMLWTTEKRYFILCSLSKIIASIYTITIQPVPRQPLILRLTVKSILRHAPGHEHADVKNRFKPLQLKQCLSPHLLWRQCPLFSSFLCDFNDFKLLGIYSYSLTKYGDNTNSTTRNYSPEFAVTGMSMKCKGALLTNRQVAHISFRHIILCVFMKGMTSLRARLTLNSL